MRPSVLEIAWRTGMVVPNMLVDEGTETPLPKVPFFALMPSHIWQRTRDTLVSGLPSLLSFQLPCFKLLKILPVCVHAQCSYRGRGGVDA